MRDQHIIKLIADTPLNKLNEQEREMVYAHIAQCKACYDKYQVARTASALLKARSAAVIEPSPFFKTRVMAAIAEKRRAQEEPAFQRFWRATRWLVSSMAVLVILLAASTFFVSDSSIENSPMQASSEIYPTELTIGSANETDEITYGQVMASIYE
ncbi:MAG TPA: hypothetical protein VEF04_23425 [Blastocatellia bacterium]|nr:hypothetical protein [Blastocatellia bacterium]